MSNIDICVGNHPTGPPKEIHFNKNPPTQNDYGTDVRISHEMCLITTSVTTGRIKKRHLASMIVLLPQGRSLTDAHVNYAFCHIEFMFRVRWIRQCATV